METLGALWWTTHPQAKELAESLASSSKVYLKTYSELLTSASNYHKEFIEKYESMKKRT